MTQYEIAKRLGISENAVSKWFKGKSLPRGEHLVALAGLLDTDVDTLLKDLLQRRTDARAVSSL